MLFRSKKKVIAWEKENLRYKEALKGLVDLCKTGLSPNDFEETMIYPEEMEAYLLDMVYRKIITKTQYDLILETRVYKRMNQKEWAKKRGIPYNTVRSLRSRAQMAIKRFEKKRRKDKD